MVKKRMDGKVSEQVEIVRVSLDEFNLATFPVSVLDKKAQRSREPLHFQDVITVAGRQIERQWKVYPHQEEGFPGPADDDVLMALFELTREQNGAKKIYFTRYQLCKKLGWPLNKFYYKRIESSFRKLGAVHVEATNAYGDQDRKKFINLGFTIIQEYKLYDETASGNKLSYVLWSDRIAASITQKLTKYLDASFYFEELETPLEKRLFRFLDSHFVQGSQTLLLNIHDLCYEHLGIARRYKYVSQLMQKLEGPLQKLVEKGFLSSWKQEGQRLQVVRSEHFAERLRISMPLAEIIADISDEPKKQEDNHIASELTARGVDAAVARDISMRAAGRYEAEVMDAVAYFDSECARGKRFANPAGLLVSLIRRSMPPEETPPARSRRAAKPQPTPDNLSRARAEIEYQEYMQRLGRQHFEQLSPSDRDRLLQEAKKDLLSGPHASRYRRMPSDRFAEHLQAVVEGRLAREKALPFDRWYSLWARSQESE